MVNYKVAANRKEISNDLATLRFFSSTVRRSIESTQIINNLDKIKTCYVSMEILDPDLIKRMLHKTIEREVVTSRADYSTTAFNQDEGNYSW